MQPAEYARNFAFEEDYWWFVGRRQLVLTTVAALAGPGRPRLLDIGCGTGYLLAQLGALTEAVGLDLADEALAFCRARQLNRLVRGRAEALPFADGSFDIVTALDILEHLDDDLAALGEWWRVLRPGGHLVLFVPAYEFLWSGEDFVSGHRRRYRRGPLLARLRSAGFRVCKATYVNAVLLPLVAGAIIGKRLFRPRSLYQSNLTPLPAWLNRLLTVIFTQEVRCLRWLNLPVGSSIFCLARKEPTGSG